MEDYKKILELNSSEQNEFLAWKCLEKSDLPTFLMLLKNDMALSAFMLTSMAVLKYDKKDIKQALIECTTIENDDVIKWMQAYFPIDELTEVLPEFDGGLLNDYPTNEVCVKFGLWATLCDRKEYDLVVQNAPDPYKILSEENDVKAEQALLKFNFEKYAPFVFARGYYGAFLLSEQGWKYLIDHGAVSWLLNIAKNGFMGDVLAKSDIVTYCLEQGLVDEVYRFIEYRSELLRQGAFEVFRKNHSWNSDFLKNYPQEVDWEDLWHGCLNKSSKRHLKKLAFEHREIQKCADFVWEHSGWIGRLYLLATPPQV